MFEAGNLNHSTRISRCQSNLNKNQSKRFGKTLFRRSAFTFAVETSLENAAVPRNMIKKKSIRKTIA